ncbi:electron transfer flavoprotein-ubiquinone oxidoreductase [Aspergillus sp. HF37]|nr:electron transfer flavoprotein-ubiquinone oxidoreductase [Aspergillus sp. HF37]
MASKSAVLPLLRRELRPSSSRIPSATRALPTISRPVRGSAGLFAASGRREARYSALSSRTHNQIRSFSQSSVRKLTDENGMFDPRQMDRESDEVDVCIVGGGPAGLASAIRLKQLANEAGNEEFRVLVLEKSSELGSHIVSGNVLQPTALNELLPDWLSEDNPSRFEDATPAKEDKMRFLTQNSSIPIPAPPQMSNHGNYILSLNDLTKWLGERAEELGVEIYAGFAGSELVYDHDGSVRGVATNDLGLGRDGQPKDNFERGMEFHARVTLLGEGCHGSLTKQVIKKYDLRRDSQPQTYGLGLKEVWEVPPEKFRPGEIVHTMGYPLPSDTYGGSWMYHFGDNMVSVGLVVGLDYPNPWLSPYGEFQKLKHHPLFKETLEGGKCISYGARALNEGGFQSIPKCAFPGGALIGDTAGFLNVPKIKGTHTAMKSGMLAAEATFSALQSTNTSTIFLFDYESALRKSPIWKELQEVRNMRPSFSTPLGLYGGILYSGLEAFLLRGKEPWTFKHHSTDADATKPASEYEKIEYPKPDGVLSFDVLTSVSRTGTNHEEDQPVHLQVEDWDKHTDAAWPKYKGVENRFCPAGVYEYVEDSSKPHGVRFQINAQNCIHCKTCDIKVPTQDINWQTPQGGEGPKYFKT